MATPSASIRSLYRQFLRTAKSIRDYNFGAYAVRRVRSRFREAVPAEVEQAEVLQQAEAELESLQRQALVLNLYHRHESVMTTAVAAARG